MAQKNPFDNILEQISQMLTTIQQNREKKLSGEVIAPEMEEDMDRLQAAMEMYNEIAEKAFRLSGESPEQIEKKISDKETPFSQEQRKFLKRADKLKQEITDLQSTYSIYQPSYDMQKKKGKKDAQKKFGDARKKKFKRLSGGDKGWMPL